MDRAGNTQRAMRRWPRINGWWIMGILILLLLLVVFHPYAIGLPGRINETRFQHALHTGMSRKEAIQLAQSLKATNIAGGSDLAPHWADNLSSGSPGKIDLLFTDYGTICIVGGRWYTLFFGADWKLRSWRVQPWGNAC
jgi:hypothetical protein